MARPVFVLRVQAAEPGVHVIRSLRAWLKQGLREFGLRCVSIEEVTQENIMVDMRKYTTGLIMPEDLRNGPRQERIANVYESKKFDYPVIEFESGDELVCWPQIGRVLARAYGYDSENWKGHDVKLLLGTYIDKKTDETRETTILETISSRDGGNSGEPQRAIAPKKDDPSDSIPS